MTVKIDATALGIKRPVEVEETGKVMKQTLRLQMALTKPIDVEAEDAYQQFLLNSLETEEKMEEYVKDILHLTPTQSDKVELLSADDLGGLVSQITAEILHLNIPEENEEEGDDSGKE